jgi:hypothetical protein
MPGFEVTTPHAQRLIAAFSQRSLWWRFYFSKMPPDNLNFLTSDQIELVYILASLILTGPLILTPNSSFTETGLWGQIFVVDFLN